MNIGMPRRRVTNVHERVVAAPPGEVGELVETLATSGDRLWPTPRWPAMRLDRGLQLESRGGHGPVRYSVVRHEPGREVAFAFTSSFPLAGEHRFGAGSAGEGHTLLRHVLEGRPHSWMIVAWPLLFRWLHDALIEDAFDRAEAEVAGEAWHPRPLPVHVRALRRLTQVAQSATQRSS